MKFSYNWLKSFFKQNLPAPPKLAELLTLKLAEVEETERKGGDFILNIDIRPNRAADCFSHMGIAKEISAICGLKYLEPSYKSEETGSLKIRDFVRVEVRDKKACPRYTAKIITGVKIGPSPKWLKEKLTACGLRPISNVVDIANYVMLETGQPLHAFDGERLSDKKIVVRFAKSKEKITTLDGDLFTLSPNVLVIADTKKPVAIAGIKGGKIPEIDRKTRTVVLESANFNPRVIRKGSQELNLKTDASLRFEHGIDPNLTEFTLNRAAYLVQKIAGGKIVRGLADVYPKKVLPKRIKLYFDYVRSLLGTKISDGEIKNILKRLNFKLLKTDKKSVLVEISTVRIDVSLQEDLIEEIGRIYGYEKIEAVFPLSALVPPEKNLNIFWEDMTKNILKEAGFNEVYNYSFFSEKEAKALKEKTKDLIEMANPLSSEQKYLRTSLIPNLLKNTEKNFRGFSSVRIFELGKIFKNPQKIEEKRRLSGLILGEEFYQMKGVIDMLLNKLGISDVWYDDYLAAPEKSKIGIWHPKKCAEIKINSEEIGFLGEVSTKVLDHFDLKGKVTLFDVDFEKLLKFVSEEHEYRPISRFPSAVRDIALLVPGKVKIVEVLNKINNVGGSLIRDIDLFDIYQGEEIPSGKKNLAFHIIYQAEDRTLSSKEIDNIQDKIVKTLEKNPEWQVRK